MQPLHGWEQAPYETKHDVDANYKRCLDWVMTRERTIGVRIGLASHNLFDVAWGHLLSVSRGVADRVEFEMLQGMAPAQSRIVKSEVEGEELLLYTPIVARQDFDVAISYLFRRLEENSADGNFMKVAFSLEPGSTAFRHEADRFRAALAHRSTVTHVPRRHQQRPAMHALSAGQETFVNEPDTDPVLPANREWARKVVGVPFIASGAPVLDTAAAVDDVVQMGTHSTWGSVPAAVRSEILHRAADELARRRADLINAMVHEGRKTFAQADPEVSEAVDFARYYGDRAVDVDRLDAASFTPFGVVAVIPPWNFPVAIPTGGVMASLAAGNRVILKPSSQTPRCAEIIAECAWAAGVPRDALQFVRTSGSEVGKRLVTSVDAVILTGSVETAALFQSWKPDLRLFAETSGKNAMIITPHADMDLAVADLVASAFGHAGQKCSAASLAICVGDVYESSRFRRQLVDAVESLEVGASSAMATAVGPTIYPVEGKLRRALTALDSDEEWLVATTAGFGSQLVAPGSPDRSAARLVVPQHRVFRPCPGHHARTVAGRGARHSECEQLRTDGRHTHTRSFRGRYVASQRRSWQRLCQSRHHRCDCPASAVRRVEAFQCRSRRKSGRPQLRHAARHLGAGAACRLRIGKSDLGRPLVGDRVLGRPRSNGPFL